MRRIIYAALAAGLLAATLAAAPASAKVDRIPVSATAYQTGTVFDPGVRWVSGNVLHLRDWSFEMRVFGTGTEGNQYMDGYIVFDSFNNNINCLTGEGNGWGELTWTSDLDLNSGWAGTFAGNYSSFVCGPPPNLDFESTGKIVVTGFGQFEGMQLRFEDVYDGDFPYRYGEGYVKVLP